MAISSSTIIQVTRDGMGQAEKPLQLKLINAYFDLLVANDKLPECICFYADGVKLTVEGSPVLEVLKTLEEKGVRLSSCETCLNYYNLMDKVKVGQIGNTLGLIETQWKAEKVITL
jgi:selenium metabolism protein YedF